MESGSSYIPRGLRVGAERLSTFSRNRFKVMPSGSDTSGPNQLCTFVLPSNSIIDLHSFKIHGDVQSNRVSNANDTVKGCLPEGSQLISRVTVSAGGTQLSQGCNSYNSVARMLKIASCSRDKDLSTDRLLSFSTLDDTPGANNVGDHVTMVWSEFLGLFSQASVRYLDTSLLGALQIQITWAGPEMVVARPDAGLGNVLTANETALLAAQPLTYTITNLYASVDTISVDQLFGDLLRKRMSEQGYISLLMKEYYTFQHSGINATSASTRFALNCGSIDKVYAGLRRDTYSQPHQDAHEVAGAILADALVSQHMRFESFDSEDDRDGTLRYQWSVNGVQHPQYLAAVSDAAFDLSYASDLNKTNTGHQVSSREQFNDNSAIFTLLLNMPDEGIALQSGLDSRGVSSQMELRLSGLTIPAGETLNCFIAAECTQEVRLGAGLAVAVSA